MARMHTGPRGAGIQGLSVHINGNCALWSNQRTQDPQYLTFNQPQLSHPTDNISPSTQSLTSDLLIHKLGKKQEILVDESPVLANHDTSRCIVPHCVGEKYLLFMGISLRV
jgi:hypothetical protein